MYSDLMQSCIPSENVHFLAVDKFKAFNPYHARWANNHFWSSKYSCIKILPLQNWLLQLNLDNDDHLHLWRVEGDPVAWFVKVSLLQCHGDKLLKKTVLQNAFAWACCRQCESNAQKYTEKIRIAYFSAYMAAIFYFLVTA